MNLNIKNCFWALASVALLVEASPYTPKGCVFVSLSEHIPRLWVQSSWGAYKRQPTDVSDIDVSPPTPLKSNEKMSPGEDFKNCFWEPKNCFFFLFFSFVRKFQIQ